MKIHLLLLLLLWVGNQAHAQVPVGVDTLALREDAKLLKKARSEDWQGVWEAVQFGANANAATLSGESLLHIAAANRQIELAEKLLRYGAEVNAQDVLGRTPLMAAVLEGSDYMAHLLACSGSNLEITDIDGKTARDLATDNYDFSILSVLDSTGCEPGVTEAFALMGRALNLARDNNSVEAINVQLAACSLFQENLGESHFKLGVCKNNLGSIYQAEGELDEAENQFREALVIVEGAAGGPSPTSGWIRNNLGRLLHARLRLTEAEEWLREARIVFESMGSGQIPDLVAVLSNLGMVLSDQGNKEEAESVYLEAWNLGESSGVDRTLIATVLNNLATLYLGRGDLKAAGDYFQEALIEYALLIQRDGLMPYLANYATIVMNFTAVLQARSDLDGAAFRLDNTIQMLEQAAPEQPILALAYSNRANVHLLKGEYAPADSLFERALEIYQETLEPNHPATALLLINLGSSAFQREDYDLAQERFSSALRMYGELAVSDPQATGLVKANLGVIATQKSDFEQAEYWISEAEKDYATAGLSANPALLQLYLNRSQLYWKRDKEITDAVLQNTSTALDQLVGFTEEILPTLSFSEQLAFLNTQLSGTIGYLFSIAKDRPELEEFYRKMFMWKGLLTENLRTSREFRQLEGNPEYETILSGLNDLRSEQADWYRKTELVPSSRWKMVNDSLSAVKELYERALRHDLGSAVGEDPLVSAQWEGFRHAFSDQEAMLDIFQYTSYEYGEMKEDNYGGVLIRGNAAPVFVHFGESAEINETVQNWLDEIRRQNGAEREWQLLREVVWSRITSALDADIAKLWISPDAMLSRVPWHLFTEVESPLVIGIVDSPREWYRLRTAQVFDNGSSAEFLLVGDLDFDAGFSKSTPTSGRFAALPGTLTELEAIQKIVPEERISVVPLVGAEGTRDKVAGVMPGARWIHLATHGFFFRAAGENAAGSRSERLFAGEVTENMQTIRNPLVESGLAFAGANIENTAVPSGLLTAEELVGIDLTQTELVVLSACDTGRGSEVTGQGVMGLRASIMAAGARSLIMSLWKVPDASTALLMEEFYRNLWIHEMSKIDALRAAQETVRVKYPAPVYWAAWVLAGDTD